jgi:D-alanyl-D-alanine carboxypeptidase
VPFCDLRSVGRASARGLIIAGLSIIAALSLGMRDAAAEALLLVEVDSGKVLHAENAAYPWYPASVTKLMTTYVTLKAIKDGRITLDTLFAVSPNAVAQQPSKMGLPLGTQVTVDNALKMLLVKSANDMAVVLAEGVSGSIEKFADEMNSTAQRLGMVQSSFVNPNGLPADEQIMSARDLAILARALIREFPEYDLYWHIPAIKFGRRIIRNTNRMIDAYPGADGMKTGFICASGFNLVATATRNNKRLIAIVLGAPSSAVRAVKAAQLLERGFSDNVLSWLTPSLGTVDALTPINAAPPNLRDEMCGPHRKRPAAEDADGDDTPTSDDPSSPYSILLSALRPHTKGAALIGSGYATMPPIVVYTGPKKTPAEAELAAAAEAAKPAGKAAHAGKRAKPGKGAHHKADAGPAAGTDAGEAAPDAGAGAAATEAAKPKAAKSDGSKSTGASFGATINAPASTSFTPTAGTASPAPDGRPKKPKTRSAAKATTSTGTTPTAR